MKTKEIQIPKRFHTKVIIYLTFLTKVILVEGTDFHSIEGNDLESFLDAGWKGALNPLHFDEPSSFKLFLEPLNSGIVGKGVWVVHSRNKTYSFKELAEYCNLGTAKIKIKYYIHNAAAYIFPCKDGPGESEYCYLTQSQPARIEWIEQEVEVIRFDKIDIEILILPGGYVMFDYVTIVHDGTEPDGRPCLPTTTITLKPSSSTTSKPVTTETAETGTSEDDYEYETTEISKRPTGTTNVPTTALPAPPKEGDKCDPHFCHNIGYCQSYLLCDKDAHVLVKEECGVNLFWNFYHPNGSELEHGGTCDSFGNLRPELQLKYKSEPECLACFWKTVGECEQEYLYQPSDQSNRNVLKFSCSKGLVFSEEKEVCKSCSDVLKSDGSSCC